ncbi:FAD/NAD(P)-binding protein [Micrococcoides hystricis]|uniref:FAD/NAD(P)-binding protein n=1 Tax=Micrococcoides hystricis TaxID=1572761 RepID=A0ABV6PAX5_9MICC
MGSFHCVLIGAGPRGTSFLERLLANLESGTHPHGAQVRLSLDVIDPYAPGAGHVWRQDQDPLFLMNTPALFPTVAPVGQTLEELAGSSVGQSFQEWLAQQQDGTGGVHNPSVEHMCAELRADGFPPRALYGAYLSDQYHAVVAALEQRPEIDRITFHQSLATGVRKLEDGRYQVQADQHVFTADTLVLALGHVPARLNPNQRLLADQAAEHNLGYIEPNISGDVEWDQIPAGEAVLMRGLGLNFFDVMIALTQGRGGRFLPAQEPGRLTYQPSGAEPIIYAASRRGVPYRGKANLDSYYPRAVQLRYFTEEHVEELVARFGKLDFRAHLWPLINRDVLLTYYRTLARERSDVFARDPEEFLLRLETMLDSAHHGEEVTQSQAEELLAAYAPEQRWLDVRALAQPAEGLTFANAQQYQQWVKEFLAHDIDSSLAGESSPLKIAIGALHRCRELLKELVREQKITDPSRIRDLAGWFGPMIEGLASGPPVQRIAELLALAEAGIVQFMGPTPVFEVEQHRDTFQVMSPWVHDEPVRARYLVEAMMPANQIQLTASVFLQELLDQKLARPWVLTNEDGLAVAGQGLDVTGRPYRLRNDAGEENIFVLGLQLSSAQWGTAIAAEAGASTKLGARTLGDADAIAVAVLNQLRAA